MRSLFLLAALCCLVFSVCGSPIARSEDEKEVGRQSVAPAQQPAASTDDDDDDDDEDDDGEFGIEDDEDDDDDDDDDEESDDDDEDDDYLERFFDDILGGEDDDDDDEPAAVQPVVTPVDTVAAAPAQAASAEEVANAAEEGEVAETEAVLEDEDAQPGQKEPSSAEVDTQVNNEEEAPAEADEEEDDDDDISDALDPEEDDDDDDDEEDDDDDDDDITDALGRNVSAKQSRALEADPPKKQVPVPAIYVVKYNHFVDTVLEKMNDILKESYDPVSVKLQPIDASKKTSKPKKNKTKSNKRKSSNKKKAASRRRHIKKKDNTKTIDVSENNVEANPQVNEIKPNDIIEQVQTEVVQSRRIKEKSGSENGKAKPTTNKTKQQTKPTKPKPKPTKSKKPTNNKNKTKSGEKNKPRAKGTLYGLSSLRRMGDVAVSIMSDHSTVKSNFAVGPLVLKVEKEVGRGAKKELKSATATTAEMVGKISLRVNNQGIATLHSIKVLQPKQVRVDSNHERTRELAWQRSARIATVVSEKLLTASRPMFQKQPVIKE